MNIRWIYQQDKAPGGLGVLISHCLHSRVPGAQRCQGLICTEGEWWVDDWMSSGWCWQVDERMEKGQKNGRWDG